MTRILETDHQKLDHLSLLQKKLPADAGRA
jgi:hypothetical protein